MKYILIICIAFILLTSCSGWNPVPVLINETNSTIRFSYDRHSKYDTLPNLTYCNETDLYYICPFTKQPFREQANWNSYFKAHPENKLSIYIINCKVSLHC